jgi:Putative prokaryotic signal transducing protein
MNWVTVHRSNGVTEAEILKNMLESFGIPARVRAEAYGKVLGMTVDGLGVADLLVPANRAKEAQDFLAEHFTAEA